MNQPDMATKPLLLLVGSSSKTSREFILETVSTRYRLWLLQPAEVTWEAPYIAASTIVDNTDPDALVAAGRVVAADHEVAGVFCYDEGLVAPAATLGQALGVPGNTPEAIAACRDKHATRLALEIADVGQPQSIGVDSLAAALGAAYRIGYPVVVKPRGLAGSMGVKLAHDQAEVVAAYEAATAVSYPGVPVFEVSVLVEEYVTGPEISVDAAFFDGRCVPLAVARKKVGFAPFFEEVGHVVDANDPLLTDPALLDALERSHRAVGFHTGVTHTEFKIDDKGLRLLEINARLGGDMIPFLGHLATGIDIAMVAADIAAGSAPDIEARHHKVATVDFLYPDDDVEIAEVIVHHDRIVAPVHSALALAAPGAVLRLPPRGYISRYGRVIAVADYVPVGVDPRDVVELVGVLAHQTQVEAR